MTEIYLHIVARIAVPDLAVAAVGATCSGLDVSATVCSHMIGNLFRNHARLRLKYISDARITDSMEILQTHPYYDRSS